MLYKSLHESMNKFFNKLVKGLFKVFMYETLMEYGIIYKMKNQRD